MSHPTVDSDYIQAEQLGPIRKGHIFVFAITILNTDSSSNI